MFLCLFTYVLIFDLTSKVSPAEIVLIVWVTTIFTEEIRQVGLKSVQTIKIPGKGNDKKTKHLSLYKKQSNTKLILFY